MTWKTALKGIWKIVTTSVVEDVNIYVLKTEEAADLHDNQTVMDRCKK